MRKIEKFPRLTCWTIPTHFFIPKSWSKKSNRIFSVDKEANLVSKFTPSLPFIRHLVDRWTSLHLYTNNNQMNYCPLISGQDNLSSTDEEADDDLSCSEAEYSGGDLEETRVRLTWIWNLYISWWIRNHEVGWSRWRVEFLESCLVSTLTNLKLNLVSNNTLFLNHYSCVS